MSRVPKRITVFTSSLAGILAGLASFSCGHRDAGPGAPGASVSAGQHQSPLPSRAEVVAKADSLSVQGAARGGADGARLLVEAAALRERVFRIDGVRADALEAIELLRGASKASWDGACDAEVRLALLQGEVETDPNAEYRALYGTK